MILLGHVSLLLCFNTALRKCFSKYTCVNNHYKKAIHYTLEGAVCCDYGRVRCCQQLFATRLLLIITINDSLLGFVVNYQIVYFTLYSWGVLNWILLSQIAHRWDLLTLSSSPHHGFGNCVLHVIYHVEGSN